MRVIRDLSWGIITAFWIAGLVGTVVLLILVVSPDARADLADLGGAIRLFVGYAAAALSSGFVLGVLRPLSRSRLGRHVVGGFVSTSAFSSILLMSVPEDFLEFPIVIGIATFVVGFVLTPLFYSGVKSGALWLPDFDSWLRGLVHSSDVNERDHTAAPPNNG